MDIETAVGHLNALLREAMVPPTDVTVLEARLTGEGVLYAHRSTEPLQLVLRMVIE